MRKLMLFLTLLMLAIQSFVPGGPQSAALAQRLLGRLAPQVQTAPAPTKILEDASAADLPQLVVHPDGPLYAGDQVSFELVLRAGDDALESVTLWVVGPQGDETSLGSREFKNSGIGGRLQASFLWAWDTGDLAPGEYRLKLELAPNGRTWTQPIRLLPANNFLQSQKWEQIDTDCCRVYYISGTTAERDLEDVLTTIDDQAALAADRLGVTLDQQIPITLLPRVVGHGGMAGREIAVSYLDRNYASGDFALVLHHEMIHWLDMRVNQNLRPTLLAEGLAVYLSGGHFKPEPLMPRAAVLLVQTAALDQPAAFTTSALAPLPRYLPLQSLADNFYAAQHEVGYLEAAALIDFMISSWGKEAFFDFYYDIQPVGGGSQAAAIDAALQKHYDISLDELEMRFLNALRRQPTNADLIEDVHLTVSLYDAIRRYQQALDPSAYFRSMWTPDPQEMRQRGIVADYVRRPDGPLNGTIETLLAAAYRSLRAGDYQRTADILEVVDRLLNAVTTGTSAGRQTRLPAMEFVARAGWLPAVPAG